MLKVNNKIIVFIVPLLLLCLNINQSFAAKRYFDESVYGNIDRTPEKDECANGINKCINQVCKSKTNTDINNAYSRCDKYEVSKIMNLVEGCLNANSLMDKIKYTPTCTKYIVDNVRSFLANKSQYNAMIAKDSLECVMAKQQFETASKCFNQIHINEAKRIKTTKQDLYLLCGNNAKGGNNKIAETFYKVGHNPNGTVKTNWLDNAGSIMVSYQLIKNDACRENIYEIPKLIDDEKRAILRSQGLNY